MGFLKRKAPPAKKEDPLAAFDAVLESLHRQGAEVRRAAATLLALRGELKRDLEKYERRRGEVDRRLEIARQAGDARAETTLTRDLADCERLHRRTLEALATAESNAHALMEAAQDITRQVADLTEERQSARARLNTGLVVSEALKVRTAEFDRLMRLDAARDEVERAHALAELYREDQGR